MQGNASTIIVKLFIAVGAFLFLFCRNSRAEQAPQPQPPSDLTRTLEVTSESVEGCCDLVFSIQESKTLEDNTQVLRVAGVHQGKPLGFEIRLGSTWKPQTLDANAPLTVYVGTVTYRSLGPESDAFLQVLDGLYGTQLHATAMAREIRFSGVTLEGDPQHLDHGPVKIKCFYESDDENRYAELYTNIDLQARKVYINEKDEEYRKAIVRALQSG